MMIRSALVLALTAGLLLPACRVSGYRLVPELAYDYAEAGPEALEYEAAKAREDFDALVAEGAKRTLTPREEIAKRSLLTREEEYAEAARVLEGSRGDILYSEKLFFTVEPLIAFDGDLATTAIPALGVNWRFLEKWKNPLAAQLVMGGALNPQASGRDVGAAIGLGISHPVSQRGSISIGYIWWDEAGDGQDGFYVGITLGDFGKKAKSRRP